MLFSKALLHNISIRDKNRKRFLRLLNEVESKIRLQGNGCVIHDYGPVYVSDSGLCRDAIAIISTLSNGLFLHKYGLISEEAQREIVQNLIQKYRIEVSRESEFCKFVDFLQDIQNAHDESFSEHYSYIKNDITSDLEEFCRQLNQIKKMYKLC